MSCNDSWMWQTTLILYFIDTKVEDSQKKSTCIFAYVIKKICKLWTLVSILIAITYYEIESWNPIRHIKLKQWIMGAPIN